MKIKTTTTKNKQTKKKNKKKNKNIIMKEGIEKIEREKKDIKEKEVGSERRR